MGKTDAEIEAAGGGFTQEDFEREMAQAEADCPETEPPTDLDVLQMHMEYTAGLAIKRHALLKFMRECLLWWRSVDRVEIHATLHEPEEGSPWVAYRAKLTFSNGVVYDRENVQEGDRPMTDEQAETYTAEAQRLEGMLTDYVRNVPEVVSVDGWIGYARGDAALTEG